METEYLWSNIKKLHAKSHAYRDGLAACGRFPDSPHTSGLSQPPVNACKSCLRELAKGDKMNYSDVCQPCRSCGVHVDSWWWTKRGGLCSACALPSGKP